MPDAEHVPQVADLLRAAGWYPGRRVPDRVSEWQRVFTGTRFVLHTAAARVLLEFGDLLIAGAGPGVDVARSDIQVDPALALGEEERCYEYFPLLRERVLFPLGEAARGHTFLVIDSTGQVFQLMDELVGHWPSFRAALEGLLLGRRSEPRSVQ